jgi:hypothetical protein
VHRAIAFGFPLFEVLLFGTGIFLVYLSLSPSDEYQQPST